MTTMKLSDVSRAATLLKKLVAKADTNRDGAVRNAEVTALSPQHPSAANPAQLLLRGAVQGAQRYAMSKGSVEVPDLVKAVDQFAASVKAADKDRDGVLSEAEYKALATMGAKRFVDFGAVHAHDKVSDFKLPVAHEPAPPRFDWSGTPKQVCTSLLAAHSSSKNDNFWPSWSTTERGPSRYVLTRAEATRMVEALAPLYPSRQKAVLTELASRSARSEFGCVSCDAGARAVFQAAARQVNATGLRFGSPAAPKMPSP